MISRPFTLPDEAATARVAAALARACGPVETLTLTGDLGAGKTTFSQYFIRTLLPGVEVTSPTFTLVHTYDAPRGGIAHVDCYRIRSPLELEEVGLAELIDTRLCLIEWPEVAAHLLPPDRLELYLVKQPGGEARTLTLTGHGTWNERLNDTLTEPTS